MNRPQHKIKYNKPLIWKGRPIPSTFAILYIPPRARPCQLIEFMIRPRSFTMLLLASVLGSPLQLDTFMTISFQRVWWALMCMHLYLITVRTWVFSRVAMNHAMTSGGGDDYDDCRLGCNPAISCVGFPTVRAGSQLVECL